MNTPGLCFPGEPTAIDPDAFFSDPGSEQYRQAKELCLACPLFFDCQDKARSEGIPYGIWGGEHMAARNRYWEKTGDRPDVFDKQIQALTGPTMPRFLEGAA